MNTLCYIICGKNKPCKVVTPIKDFYPVPDHLKKYYFGPNPVIYIEIDNSVHVTELENIVYCDLKKSAGYIGRNYKIPNEYIKPAAA